MKDLTVSAAEIARVLQQFISATQLKLTIRVQPHPGQVPDLTVDFDGPDSDWLTSGDGELLGAFEVLCSEIHSPEHPELLSCRVFGEGEQESSVIGMSIHFGDAQSSLP